MARRMISFAAVMIMLFSSFIIIASDGSEAASTAPVTVHPIPDSNNLPWVTSSAIPYIDDFTIYFEEDPYEAAKQIIEVIDAKREALGINKKQERKLLDQKDRREIDV